MLHVVAIEATLHAERPITPDEVTDLIESVVDALDAEGFVPDVSTTSSGTSVDVTVEVIVNDGTPSEFERGVSAIARALEGAGVEGHDLLAEIQAATSRVLEPA